jgi:arsenate reductase-like glutaredoxin family protein
MGKGMGCAGSTPVNTDKVDDPSDAAPAADSDPVAKAEVKKYNGKAEMASIRRWRDSLPAPLQEIFKEKWNDETPMDDWDFVSFANEDGDSPNLYSDVTDDMYLKNLEINCDNDEEKHAFPPIGKFSNLKYLEISGPWSSFAKDFVQCTTLTSVTVRNYAVLDDIKSFISVIESNPDIENLNITQHGCDGDDDAVSVITSILPAICNLKKLETLDLTVWDVGMSPVVLPAGLSKLASLTSLTLSINVDSKSFAVISKLPKLENLAIQAGHSITDDAKKDAWKSPIVLPAEFSKFASLTSLTFNDTAVDPKSLAVIPNLRDLTLGGFAWMYESEAVCNMLRNMKHLVDFRCDGDTLGFATGGCTIKLPDDLKAEMFSRKRLKRWSDNLDRFLGNTLPNADDTYKALEAAANATDDDDDWDKLNEYREELLISPKFVADKKKAVDDVGNDADAIAAYIKKNYVKVDDEDEEFEEEFRDISADDYGDDNYDVNDPNIRLLVEAAIAAYLDKFGYEGKTLDQIRAEFPTSFSLLAFYNLILPDTEEPDKDDLYTETDVYKEVWEDS